jgi:hypothetical protein
MLSSSLQGTIETTDWISQSGKYRYDIDITVLDSTGYAIVTSFFADNAGTMEQIQPDSVDLIPNGSGLYSVARVWMSTNTLDVLYNLSSGIGISGGSGGGGGTTNHSLLSNLDYASSGHTGFADNNHDNTQHSLNFITASSVTYANMDANGDVGDLAGQLAIGDHTHISGDTHNYNDIPTGEIILFEKDTVVTGYSLLTTVDDGVVYITKGSAAGGETGGTAKTGGTWTQPNHTHTISTQTAHTHDTNDHTLTESEIPSHTHNYNGLALGSGGTLDWDGEGSAIHWPDTQASSSTGGGNAHNHGATDLGGSHAHGGSTGNSATVNTWRPVGRNFTRQQRI